MVRLDRGLKTPDYRGFRNPVLPVLGNHVALTTCAHDILGRVVVRVAVDVMTVHHGISAMRTYLTLQFRVSSLCGATTGVLFHPCFCTYLATIPRAIRSR